MALRVVEGKSEEGERTVALSLTLVDALSEQYQRTACRGDELVFCHPTRGSRVDPDWYAVEFRTALTTAGVEATCGRSMTCAAGH